MIHNLKILPAYFNKVAEGWKTFEVRRDDRPFAEGDTLRLQEFDGDIYTGRAVDVVVTYILRDINYCKEGFCILGIKPIFNPRDLLDTCYFKEIEDEFYRRLDKGMRRTEK